MHVLLSVWIMLAGAEPEPEPEPELVETTEAVDTTESPEVVTPPRLLETVAADRPDGAGDEAVEVLLSLEIDTEGRVTRAEVVESGGDAFDEAARQAARRFRFEPATAGGEPIAVEIGYRYVFEPPPPPDPEPPALESTIDDTEVVLAAAIDEDAAEIQLGAERGQRTPGAQGDALKAAETLAGVARPPAGQGELIIWGASASDSRRTIDGIVVPRLFHLGGTRSVLPSAMLDSVSLVPGGFSVARGRAVGGYVSATTRPARSAVDPHRVGGYVRLDPIDVGASVDARVTDRGWVALAVRRSLIAQTYGALAPASSQGLVPLPDYWDYQGKSIVEVSGRDTLTVVGFGA
ncbi:MAG: TonB family protein, partial [Nannocystaceae bacterium]